MPRIKSFCLSLLLTSALIAKGFGAFTMQSFLGHIDGSTIGDVAVLVADTGGDGFAGVAGAAEASTENLLGRTLFPLAGTNPVNPANVFGTNDLIIDVFTLADLGFGGPIGVSTSGTYDHPSLAPDQELGIYWFYGMGSGETVDSGQSFGFFRTDTVDLTSGANYGFSVPADGTNKTISAVSSEDLAGTAFSRSDFTANNGTVIPEPSGAALIALSGLLFVRRRRR